MTTPQAPALRCELRAHHLFALSFGSIVGTGWIPGGIVTLVAATLASMFTVSVVFREAWRNSAASIPIEWIIFGIWVALGAVFWLVTRRSRHAISESQRRETLLGHGETGTMPQVVP